MLLFSACSTQKIGTNLNSSYSKICLDSSGKGRIELLTTKYLFSYEAQTDFAQNVFNLSLTFPIVGEKVLAFDFNEERLKRNLESSEITQHLLKQFGNRTDIQEVSKALEMFILYSAEIMKAKAANKFPINFESYIKDNNFYLERSLESNLYQLEASTLNENYFERLKFRIFSKSNMSNPILTLFLITDSCDIK